MRFGLRTRIGSDVRSLTQPTLTSGLNISGASILDICRNWPWYTPSEQVTAGGTMTINSVALGAYDWVNKSTSQTVSTSNMADWFSGRVDDASAWVIVNGNLTINSGVLFTPPARKLFTVVYVSGNLTVNGTISMSRRGANHSGTGISGGATTAGAIAIAVGTFSSVTNPQVPAAGGAGGAAKTGTGNGNAGTAGTAGGTGGGGSGGNNTSNANNKSGAGGDGTSFSGGSGGGGLVVTDGAAVNGKDAGSNGGAGGDATSSGGNISVGPGTGNPGGAGLSGNNLGPGNDGTGGVLIVICEGTLSGSGTISADGVNVGPSMPFRTGGASGGGSVTVLYKTDSSSITPTATGGLPASAGGGSYGGAGGNGTARKLAL